MLSPHTLVVRQAMKRALARGLDPYNSHEAFAKSFRCVWSFNFRRR
jgi:hypothetical protein